MSSIPNPLLPFFAVLLFISGERSAHAALPAEPIPMQWMVPGITDTLWLDDLVPADVHQAAVIDPAGLAEMRVEGGRLILRIPLGSRAVFLPRLRIAGESKRLLIAAAPRTPVEFRWAAADPAQKVRLFGTMNSWNRESLPMADDDGDGLWQRVVPLEAGRYEYKFWVDGHELLDPRNPQQVGNGFGGFNNVLEVADSGLHRPPRLHFGPWRQISAQAAELRLELDPGEDAAGAETTRLTALWDDRTLPVGTVEQEGGAYLIRLSDLRLPGWRRGEHVLRFIHAGQEDLSNLLRLDVSGGAPAGIERAGFHWRDAILYSLVTDRFRNADPNNDAPVDQPELGRPANWLGGDWAGVGWGIESGYFSSLAVDALWLSPVQRAPDEAWREYPEPHRYFTGYHGYWPVRPRETEARFGSLKELQKLVQSAHQHDMAIMLDLVSNHVHQDHPYFQEHPDWFGHLLLRDGSKNLRRFDEHRLTTWFEPYLPAFDHLGSAAGIEALVDDAVWWLNTTGADAFRHDATKHVPHVFWRELTAALAARVEAPRANWVFQIGETFGSDELVGSYVNPGQQDAQFDFASYYIARAVLIDPERSLAELGERMERVWRRYGAGHLLGNVINTHDQLRFASLADGDVTLVEGDAKERGWNDPPRNDDPTTYARVRLFLAWILTTPGLPVLYYGDEIAMPGLGDPDNRRPMRFGAELENLERAHLEATRRLTQLRRDHVALRRGDLQVLQATADLLVYERAHPVERIVVALNRGDRATTLRVQLHQGILPLSGARDLLTGAQLRVFDGRLSGTVAPRSARIIQLRTAEK